MLNKSFSIKKPCSYIIEVFSEQCPPAVHCQSNNNEWSNNLCGGIHHPIVFNTAQIDKSQTASDVTSWHKNMISVPASNNENIPQVIFTGQAK